MTKGLSHHVLMDVGGEIPVQTSAFWAWDVQLCHLQRLTKKLKEIPFMLHTAKLFADKWKMVLHCQYLCSAVSRGTFLHCGFSKCYVLMICAL